MLTKKVENTMPITLSTEIETKLNDCVRSGAVASADQIVLLGLQMIEAQKRKLAALRHDLQEGLDDLQAGRFTTYSSKAELDALADEIIYTARRRRS